MSDPVILVALVGFAGIFASAVIGPAILARLSASALVAQKKLEAELAEDVREAEWARQDLVAERAEKAARAQLEATRQLQQATARVAVRAADVEDKVDVIHTLVNGQLTHAMQSEMDAEIGALVNLREIVELRKSLGHEPSKEALDLITAKEAKVAELKAKIAERLRLDKVGNAQTAAQAAARSGTQNADRIVAAIENLPGQDGEPQDVKIMQPASEPVPVKPVEPT